VEFGFLSATDGLAAAGIVRPVENALRRQPVVLTHDEELLFFFILSGSVSVACHGEGLTLLNAGDACVIPCHTPHALVEPSVALEMLEVRLCGEFTKIREPMSYNALSKNLSNQSMSTC
jgi:mannose-6-phosphate isomerase-like protein (cupin superfamily)